jgi:hypothetical protein
MVTYSAIANVSNAVECETNLYPALTLHSFGTLTGCVFFLYFSNSIETLASSFLSRSLTSKREGRRLQRSNSTLIQCHATFFISVGIPRSGM